MTGAQLRVTAGFAAALLVAACGPSASTGASGVEGTVLAGPRCPIGVEPGLDCADYPVEADLEVQDSSGRVVARARSDEQGDFRIGLHPGEYLLVPLRPGGSTAPFPPAPIPFVVRVETWERLDVHYDSGIR